MSLFYVDASAVVKTVLEEKGTDAARAFLAGAQLVSSELLLTEVPRALRRAASENPALSIEALLQRAARQIDSISMRPLDDALLIGAGLIAEPALRSLDAIHVVTALHLSPIDAFVGYDERQAAVARLAGLRTLAPGVD